MQVSKTIAQSITAGLLSLLSGTGLAYDTLSQSLHIKAHGNDPDWSVEIPADENRLTFTFAGVATTYRYPALGPTLHTAERTTIYRVPNDKHSLTVFVKGNACQDTTTGKSHEMTVIVSYDGKGYRGCGDVLNR
jgi:uncharacterized membrane protein